MRLQSVLILSSMSFGVGSLETVIGGPQNENARHQFHKTVEREARKGRDEKHARFGARGIVRACADEHDLERAEASETRRHATRDELDSLFHLGGPTGSWERGVTGERSSSMGAS